MAAARNDLSFITAAHALHVNDQYYDISGDTIQELLAKMWEGELGVRQTIGEKASENITSGPIGEVPKATFNSTGSTFVSQS